MYRPTLETNLRLKLSDKTNQSFTLRINQLSIHTNAETPPQVQFVCETPWILYRKILSESWLNVDSIVQHANAEKKITIGIPLDLKVSLTPELTTQIIKQVNGSDKTGLDKTGLDKTIEYLHNINQNQPRNLDEIHPFLQEQNWYCTTICQTQPNGEEITHHTLWHYLLPTLQNPTPDNIADSITHYITDQTTASLNQITQATDPLFQDIAQTFQDLFTVTLTDLETTPETDNTSDTAEPSTLLTPLTDFLEAEGWPYAQLPEGTTENTTLRLAFRGENGQWPCYAKINQTQKTLCFYSLSPIPSAPACYPEISEYLTRANYGTILGNFELDYTDGEIRYKTSIDVEGDTLTPALLQNLIYTNVMMMDQYLPGILAVLEQGTSPAQAIALIEKQLEQQSEEILSAS